MLLQAIAEYGTTNSNVSLGARINRAAQWLGSEVESLADAATRSPGAVTLGLAVVIALLIARALSAR